MQAAFAEHQGALPVESGAHTETVDDVLAVMQRGGAVLAFLGSEPVGSARYYVDNQDLYVARVSVLPSHRRQGIASAMMRFFEGLAPSMACQQVRIGVRESLPSNVGLYRALGYELTSSHRHPRGADQVLTMVKPVAAAHEAPSGSGSGCRAGANDA